MKGGSKRMIRSLTKLGDDMALVIDEAILGSLRIGPETPFEITTDGRSLIVTPVRTEEEREAFRGALDEVNRRHGEALKRLEER